MSSKQFNKTFTSLTEPTNGLVGDEWFNPTTNKLYKFLPVNKLAPQWCELPQTNVANSISFTNLSSNGYVALTGSPSSMALSPTNIAENVSLMSSPLVGVVRYNVTAQTVAYVTAQATGTWTLNITGSDSVNLNSVLAVGQSVSLVMLVTNGATAYYSATLMVDGFNVTPKWAGGTAPSSGNASSIDSYAYTVIKTGNATFSVLASQTKFA